MPHLIEVAFRGNRNEFFLWDLDAPPPLRAAVIVEADRGEDLGHVHAVGELAARRSAGASHGLGPETLPEKRALRLATADDVRRAEELGEQNEGARRKAMERVKTNGLVMKLTDAEWQWDRKKLTFYFTAEKRVDFRNLVRDLASMFRTRIELKQIGVRDEAKRLDGIGRCGRRYCSASWLPELRPVNLGVAKDQRLSLNPSQISGACGRLMCCLRYEHEFYVQSRKRFPKEGKIVVTSLGEEKVIANDIFNDRVTLRRPDGDARVVALADLKLEIASHAPGDDVSPAPADDTAVGDAESSHDEGDGEAAEGSLQDEEAADGRRNGGGGSSAGSRPPRGPNAGRSARGDSRGAAAAGRSRPGDASPPPADAGASGAAPAGGAWLRLRAPLPQVASPDAAGASTAALPPVNLTVNGGPGTPTAGAGDGAQAQEDRQEQQHSEERRGRRRRGRRGGRRGRGGSGGGPTGSGGGQSGDDAESASGADDAGAEE